MAALGTDLMDQIQGLAWRCRWSMKYTKRKVVQCQKWRNVAIKSNVISARAEVGTCSELCTDQNQQGQWLRGMEKTAIYITMTNCDKEWLALYRMFFIYNGCNFKCWDIFDNTFSKHCHRNTTSWGTVTLDRLHSPVLFYHERWNRFLALRLFLALYLTFMPTIHYGQTFKSTTFLWCTTLNL